MVGNEPSRCWRQRGFPKFERISYIQSYICSCRADVTSSLYSLTDGGKVWKSAKETLNPRLLGVAAVFIITFSCFAWWFLMNKFWWQVFVQLNARVKAAFNRCWFVFTKTISKCKGRLVKKLLCLKIPYYIEGIIFFFLFHILAESKVCFKKSTRFVFFLHLKKAFAMHLQGCVFLWKI